MIQYDFAFHVPDFLNVLTFDFDFLNSSSTLFDLGGCFPFRSRARRSGGGLRSAAGLGQCHGVQLLQPPGVASGELVIFPMIL